MEKKKPGIFGLIEKHKEKKELEERFEKEREEKYRKIYEENRKYEAEKNFKLDIIKKAYEIARELGNEITRWSEFYEDIEVIKYDFQMAGIRIVLDMQYYDAEKYGKGFEPSDSYKKKYLFIFINGDKVFESQMCGDKPYDLDKFSNSDWPKVIDKIHEFLPRLKEEKKKREKVEKEKAMRLDTLRDYLDKFIEIQSYQGDPYTIMAMCLENNDITIGRDIINDTNPDSNKYEFTIKYTIYHKSHQVLDFFFKNNAITVTPLNYLQGEWENGFKSAIDLAYRELEAKNISRINNNVNRTLAKINKMY